MVGVKLIAKQVQTVKGYEQFETVTGSDGHFKFPDVYSLSDYTIIPWSDNWKTSASITIRSGAKSQLCQLYTKLLRSLLSLAKTVIHSLCNGNEI